MEYIFTERAHLACPNMCFAIAACIGKAFDKARIEESVKKLAEAHPFLMARLGYEKETDSYFYDVKDGPQVDLIFADDNTDTGDLACDTISSHTVIEQFEILTSRDWNLFTEGFLKITVWNAGNKTVILFVFHHLLADGRGALGLIQEFADFYANGIEPKSVPEHLITKEDLPENSRLSFISRILVAKANNQWKKENHHLLYEEYHAFAEKFLQEDSVAHSVEVISPDKLTALHAECKSRNISINDYLLAQMFLEEKTDSIIMACDLRNQLACYKKGALGNYSTAFSVKLKASKSADTSAIFSLAKKVHKQIQKKLANPKDLYLVLQCYASLEPGLLDAAMISSRNSFDSKAAKFIGANFFGYASAKGHSITNLGKIESKNIESAYFIPPASPAIKKTLGVLTVNGTMRICTSERK